MFAGLYSAASPVPTIEPRIDPLTGTVDQPGDAERYVTQRLDTLSAYEGRLYVDWGGGSSGKRAWVQRAELQDKVVTELRLDAIERPFPGLMALTLSLSTLGDAPSAWCQALSHAKGVYLLTCPRDGSLYVGSAPGEGGFQARWAEYAANGHGGNVALRGRESSDYIASVLQVAGSADTPDDILAAETAWKRKLNSVAVGLNRN